MAASPFGFVLQHVRKLAASPAVEQASDAHLLERFHRDGDEIAFTALVERHAGLVWNVCRSILRSWHDAEDTFQATFLTLARKPGSIRHREAVAGWLAGVAYHLALKVRDTAARRRVHEERAAVPRAPDPFLDMTLRDLHCVLYEELRRLPEKCRAPLVLCYLEGRTHEQAARQLGWTKDTVRGRLNRGRERLRARLTRRGITLSAGLLTTALATAAAPSAVVANTVQLALAQAAGSAVAGAVAPPWAGFFGGTANVLLTAKGKLTLLVLLVLGLLGASLIVSMVPDPPAPAGAAAPPEPPGEPDKPAPPRTDQFGDPLPPGALARMGTTRFRHGSHINRLAYAPDRKTLFSIDFEEICAWDTANGKEIRHLHGFTARGSAFALAPDGKTIAGDCEGKVQLWDLATGHKVRSWEIPVVIGSREVREGEASLRRLMDLAYAPDGRHLATATAEGILWLWDAVTGRAVRRLTEPKTCTGPIVFSPDGRVVAYGCPANTIRLTQTASGQRVGEFRFGGSGKPGTKGMLQAFGFSPDGKTLAVTFTEVGRQYRERTLYLWDVVGAREIRRWTGQEDGIAQFAFPGDGKTLALGGADGTIRLWDLTADRETRRFSAHPAGVSALAASPDGKTLASAGGDLVVRQWDLATGKERALEGGHQNGVQAAAFLPDGRTLATAAGDDTLRFWDTSTGRELRRCEACEFVGESGIVGTVLLPTPDGRTVLANCKGPTVRFWDAAGHERRRLPLTPDRPAVALALAPDGKTLAVAELTLPTAIPPLASRVSLWDLAAGKELRELEGPHPVVVSLAFLPDGGTVLGCNVDLQTDLLRVHAWDPASGKERRRFDVLTLGRAGPAFAFSADGRWLAVQDGIYKGTDLDFTVCLWDAAAGKEVRRLKATAQPVGTLAFSPDGRTLAAASEHDATIRCWEVATGAERHRFVGHRGRSRALAFSADGTLLASGTSDTTAVIWDVSGRLNPRQGPPTAREVEAWWADLLGDAARADRAIWALTAAPEQALPQLRQRLQPAVPADAGRVGRLLAGLDSKNFAARKQAAAELEQLAELAEPVLRRALAEKPTAEVARQLEGLLERAERAVQSPQGEGLRGVRALEVLEHIGSPAARTLVEALAAGLPEAGLTREAKATRQRLARRPAAGSMP
jgi:RNA polymerase sigma factor (sigma-70 family)